MGRFIFRKDRSLIEVRIEVSSGSNMDVDGVVDLRITKNSLVHARKRIDSKMYAVRRTAKLQKLSKDLYSEMIKLV